MPRTKAAASPVPGSGDRRRATAAPRRPPVPRELDAQIEERNRERHSKPETKLPKTFPATEQEGERLQKVLARAGMGSRRACEELIEQRPRRGQRADRHRAGPAGRPREGRDQGRRSDRRHPVVPVLRAEQARRRGLHHGGPRRPPVPRRLRHQPRDPALPRRAARHRDRGPHPAHQPRRAGAPAHPPALRRQEDLPRRDPGPAAARPGQAAQGRHPSWRTASPAPTTSGSWRTPARTTSSR